MTSRHAGFFTAVLAFHVLALWALHSGLALKVIDRLPQASLVVQLLAPQIQPPVPLPVAEIPPPPPVAKPRPPKPLEHAITEPEPLPAPGETVPDEPVPVEQPPVVTAAELAPVPAPVAPPPEPIAPPRFDAAYLSNPAPAYPALSKRIGEQGNVQLRVYVRSDGSAERVEIQKSSGHSRLDQAALEAVRRWKFVPAMRGSEAVAAWVLVPISYKLTD